ncbi:gamma subclass chorismate mutase AroQ [Enterovibrio sp. ZSDZ35]|uniref:chorismate mutase n=1 Tax=Enterovibrio qingdaonensis TaxID=2899818 RepID=A0ABT5QJ97_9GAMM|nr:gamma subclass chorismate mutase AroQ [Enterovibrio sp. ZSDZ35]MDD1781060.1 gamma subclass chorismate mutase AroQ [Enterovibrio sp. ZSDZ35]
MSKHWLFTILTFCSFSVFANPSPNSLFTAINERLSYMEDVALFKANNQRPIEDIEREKVVINKASESAKASGLNQQSVIGFFTAQISAAKAIQYRYRADLLTEGTARKPRDLTTEVRPELIRLGKTINTEVALFLREGREFRSSDWHTFESTINQEYLTSKDKKKLFNALTQIRLL